MLYLSVEPVATWLKYLEGKHLLVPEDDLFLNFNPLENAMEAIQLAEKIEWCDFDVVSIQVSDI